MPPGRGGLISLPAVGSDPRITAAARAVILRHELSHGEFFSSPEYAEYVREFWMTELTGEERGSVRGFLGKEDYDVREEELMYNEMQAYLMFTRDPADLLHAGHGRDVAATAGRTARPVPGRHARRMAAQHHGAGAVRRAAPVGQQRARATPPNVAALDFPRSRE